MGAASLRNKGHKKVACSIHIQKGQKKEYTPNKADFPNACHFILMVYLMNLERLGMGNLFWAWWLFITIGERELKLLVSDTYFITIFFFKKRV